MNSAAGLLELTYADAFSARGTRMWGLSVGAPLARLF